MNGRFNGFHPQVREGESEDQKRNEIEFHDGDENADSKKRKAGSDGKGVAQVNPLFELLAPSEHLQSSGGKNTSSTIFKRFAFLQYS